MRLWASAICALLAVAVAGCAPKVRTDVNRFPSTNLPTNFDGKTFVFMPTDKQQGSLEYERHAAAISAFLEKQGLRRINDEKTADYAVAFSYGQSGGRPETHSAPIYGQTGGGYPRQSLRLLM